VDVTRRILLLLALAVLAIFLWPRGSLPPPRADDAASAPSPTLPARPASESVSAPPPAPPFAERILEQYADPARPPEDDLQAMARTLDNFSLLVKGDNPLPLGANEEIAAALRGKNKAALRALPDTHRAFNDRGQLVDRWGTPLYFHAQARDRLEIRSAGPDRAMWTADDLHRLPDGRYLRGDTLLAPSLYETPRAPRPK
jgi:hypothetical protein